MEAQKLFGIKWGMFCDVLFCTQIDETSYRFQTTSNSWKIFNIKSVL